MIPKPRRIRASLLTHSGSSEAARNAARRNAHTSKANTERQAAGGKWSAYALRDSGVTSPPMRCAVTA